jgi:hypothetical protein
MAMRGIAVAACAVTLLAAACGNSTTAPSAVPGTSAPAASGSASVAPSQPSASPHDPATAAIQAFVAFASNPKSSYQATFSGESRQTITIIKITKGLLQVNGADVLVRATFTFPDRRSGVVEHRFVDGKPWIRLDRGRWQRLTDWVATDSMAAFPAVRALNDVTYLGPKKVAGKTLFQVQVRSAIVNPVMIPEINLSDTVVTSPKLVVLIDAAGRPVSGTAEIDGRGRVSGQLQELVIDLTIKFIKVGQPVSIAAP